MKTLGALRVLIIIIIRLCKGISFFALFRFVPKFHCLKVKADRTGKEEKRNNLATVESPTKDDSDLFK